MDLKNLLIDIREKARNFVFSCPFVKKLENLPNTSGIYFLTNSKQRILYVGCTVDFNQRWSRHEYKREFEQEEDYKIFFIEREKLRGLEFIDLNTIEGLFISFLLPPYNRKCRWNVPNTSLLNF